MLTTFPGLTIVAHLNLLCFRYPDLFRPSLKLEFKTDSNTSSLSDHQNSISGDDKLKLELKPFLKLEGKTKLKLKTE
jgi:hypothetical protein